MALIRKAHSVRKYGYSWINVHKGGVITISQRLALALDIKHGDCVAFYQDDIRPKIWFVRKEYEGLRINKGNRSCFKINSSSVASDLLHSLDAKKTVKIKVSTARQENGMFEIITMSAEDMQGNKLNTFS